MFDGNAYDESGNAFHGTVHGPVTAAGRYNKPNTAFLFNGTSDYIELPVQVALNSDSSFSIEAWISKNCYTSDGKYYDGGIFGQTDGSRGSDYPLVALEVNGNKTLRGVVRGCADPALNVFSEGTLTDDTWNHIVLVWDAPFSRLSLYLNGVLVGSGAEMLNGNTVSNDFVSVGAFFDDMQKLYHFFCGRIDELRIWRTALSISQISALKRNIYTIK
jgi:hypothetical protein